MGNQHSTKVGEGNTNCKMATCEMHLCAWLDSKLSVANEAETIVLRAKRSSGTMRPTVVPSYTREILPLLVLGLKRCCLDRYA
jgi:hypothetical protein